MNDDDIYERLQLLEENVTGLQRQVNDVRAQLGLSQYSLKRAGAVMMHIDLGEVGALEALSDNAFRQAYQLAVESGARELIDRYTVESRRRELATNSPAKP